MTSSNKLIKLFIVYLNRQGKSESTRIAYKKDLEQLAETNTRKGLIDFSNDDIRSGMQYLKKSKELSPKTLSRKLNSYRTFYKYLVSTKRLVQNPALNVEHPRYIPKKKRILKPTEYLALKEISRANERLYTMIELLLQTGIRISELSELKISDVDINKKQLHIRPYESNDERKIPLNHKILIVLKSYLNKLGKSKANSPLFATRTYKKIEVRNIRSSIDRAIMKAKLKDVCVNDLRNTFITHQLSEGASISFVAEIVGHKNEVTTHKYLRLLTKKYKPSGKDEVYEL